jgi:hypothetical protein
MKGLFHSIVMGLAVVTWQAASIPVRPELSRDDIALFSESTMHRMLKDRDVDCMGCVEKEHYIEKVFETQAFPIVKKKKKSTKKKSPQDEANIAEV